MNMVFHIHFFFNMKDKSTTVYMHKNKTNGMVYIGITSQKPERRWKNGNGYKSNEHFFNSIKKYGWDGFYHIIIKENITHDEAALLEQELIQNFDATNPEKGYNKTKGGDRNFPSDQTIKKIKEAHKNKLHSGNFKKGHIPITIGTKRSKNTKNKISNSIKEKVKNNEIDYFKRPVICMDSFGKETYFKSAKNAADILGLFNGTHILECCKYKRKTCANLFWRFPDSDYKNILFCNGMYFSSITEISKYFNKSRKYIKNHFKIIKR